MYISLDQLNIGEYALVKVLSDVNLQCRNDLIAMGLRQGTYLQYVHKGANNQLMNLLVEGVSIVIERAQAVGIKVQRVQPCA